MTNTTRFASILHPCLALAACGDNARGLPDAPPPPPMSRAVIVAGDFTMGHPGILTTLDPDSRAIRSNAGPAMAVGADPILRHIGRELLIVNRIEHNITILERQGLVVEDRDVVL